MKETFVKNNRRQVMCFCDTKTPPIIILNQTTTYERMSDSYLSETKITGDNFLDFKNKMIVSPTHTCIYRLHMFLEEIPNPNK